MLTERMNESGVMTQYNITRVAIFVDFDNFVISYCKHHKLADETEIDVWDELSTTLIAHYNDRFLSNEREIVDCAGVYLCVGMSEFISWGSDESKRKRWFQSLDRYPGFVVRYGTRNVGYRDKKTRKYKMGSEKGVDAEIICQMLMGAFMNHYDSCVLLSDDSDYLPAIRRIQEYFGKKVIQAGFKDSRTRNQSFGHIPFEEMDKSLRQKSDRAQTEPQEAQQTPPSQPR